MLYIITSTKYIDNDDFDVFLGLVEGDLDPLAVVNAVKRKALDELEAWRKANPCPKRGSWLKDTASEDEWMAFHRAEFAIQKHYKLESAEQSRINTLYGREPLDILLKNGFRAVTSEKVSL